MAVNNSLQSRSGGKPKFSVAIQTPMYQKLVNDTLGDPDRARRFVAAISSAVAVNPSLQECDAGTVLTAALLGESLNLSPSPQLGQYYMVPYKDKKRGTVAQFQLGYKGYIQLAERSGQYLDIDAFPVVEGEYRGRDRFTRRPILEFLEDDGDRESRPVVGYYAYFELNNGFRKVLYWSKDKMLAHADRYSQAFHLEAREAQDPRYSRVSYADFVAGNYPKGDEWKYSSFWYKDFDGMACKTMLRQLISKWGIMSIDLQKALASDEAAIGTDGSKNYLDAPENAPEALPEANPETGEIIEPSSNTAPELPNGAAGACVRRHPYAQDQRERRLFLLPRLQRPQRPQNPGPPLRLRGGGVRGVLHAGGDTPGAAGVPAVREQVHLEYACYANAGGSIPPGADHHRLLHRVCRKRQHAFSERRRVSLLRFPSPTHGEGGRHLQPPPGGGAKTLEKSALQGRRRQRSIHK